MPRDPEFRGRNFTIECLELPDGSCPAGEFLDGLENANRRRLQVLFERLGEMGKINNVELFKKLRDTEGIFEFKRHQIRIPCFFTRDKRVMLCFGVIKKKDDLKSEDIKRAERYAKQFLERAAAGE